MCFRLVPKSVTLNDHERRNGRHVGPTPTFTGFLNSPPKFKMAARNRKYSLVFVVSVSNFYVFAVGEMNTNKY